MLKPDKCIFILFYYVGITQNPQISLNKSEWTQKNRISYTFYKFLKTKYDSHQSCRYYITVKQRFRQTIKTKYIISRYTQKKI